MDVISLKGNAWHVPKARQEGLHSFEKHETFPVLLSSGQAGCTWRPYSLLLAYGGIVMERGEVVKWEVVVWVAQIGGWVKTNENP